MTRHCGGCGRPVEADKPQDLPEGWEVEGDRETGFKEAVCPECLKQKGSVQMGDRNWRLEKADPYSSNPGIEWEIRGEGIYGFGLEEDAAWFIEREKPLVAELTLKHMVAARNACLDVPTSALESGVVKDMREALKLGLNTLRRSDFGGDSWCKFCAASGEEMKDHEIGCEMVAAIEKLANTIAKTEEGE